MARNGRFSTLDEFAVADDDREDGDDPATDERVETDGRGEQTQRPPSVQKRRAIKHPFEDNQVGSLVWDHSREWNAYLSKRDEADNLFHKYNAYPISTRLLGKLQHYKVRRVLIAVRDDTDHGRGTVYEFELETYLPEQSPTFEWERDTHVDEQVCPDKDKQAVHVWPELGRDLYYNSV